MADELALGPSEASKRPVGVAHAGRGFWHFGQKKLLRPAMMLRRIFVLQRKHFSPSRSYARCRIWNSPGSPLARTKSEIEDPPMAIAAFRISRMARKSFAISRGVKFAPNRAG